MFRQIVRFFSRIFQSKGIRIAAKVIFWALAGNFLLHFLNAAFYFMRKEGMSFHEVSGLLLDVLPFPNSRIVLSVVLGLIIGFMAYNRGRKNKTASEEEKPEENPAEKTDPEPAKEEEIIETTHYMFH